jgi:hypothetical protein
VLPWLSIPKSFYNHSSFLANSTYLEICLRNILESAKWELVSTFNLTDDEYRSMVDFQKRAETATLFYRDLHDVGWFDFEVGGCYACAEENYYYLMTYLPMRKIYV